MTAAGTAVRRCAVLGHPVAHSLSPAMHRAAYASLGLGWTYESFDVDEDGLAGWLGGLDATWRGLSLTMPLKRAAVPLCDELSAVARRVGGVNTVLLEDGGRRHGDNTDVPGFVAALAERQVSRVRSAVVLGGGATAASAAAALIDVGMRRLHLAVRDPSRATVTRRMLEHEGVEVSVGPLLPARAAGASDAVDVLVSTVPAAVAAEFGPAALGGIGTVFDVVYDPWPTPLSRTAATAGAQVLDGLDLLAHQARLQVRGMTGLDVAVDVLRTAARAELVRRRG